MREIKFRVWDKDTKHMHICGEDIHDEIDFEYETNKAYYYNLQNGCGSLREDSSYILMQYTGLHDKNGKEIFEGDIVNCQTKYGKAKAIIKFIDGKFVAYWDSKITHPKNGHHIACYDINKRFEVIGNIYENKELLNETN